MGSSSSCGPIPYLRKFIKPLVCFRIMLHPFCVLMGSRGKKVWGPQHVGRNSQSCGNRQYFWTNCESGKFPVGEEIWWPVKKRHCFKLEVEFLWLLGSDCEETTLVVLKSLSESEPHTADLDTVAWRERGEEGRWVAITGSGMPHSLLPVPILSFRFPSSPSGSHPLRH